MKTNYHNKKIFLGSTDIARFTLVYPEGCTQLHTGEDGCFDAYLLTHSQGDVPEHYRPQEVLSTGAWLKVFDDTDLTVHIDARAINVYECGRGTLIYVSDDFKVRIGQVI